MIELMAKVVVVTPKALANFSPGLERSDNPGYTNKQLNNAESVRHVRE